MIKKIIALVITLALFLAVPLYDVITNPASPIEFGAGDGVSEIIENPEKFKELIASIPDVEAYLENETMLDVNPDFKSFTMVENGVRKESDRNLVDDGAEAYYEVEEKTKDHVLEMYYAENALYYHAVGQMTTSTEKYGATFYENEYNYSYDFRWDDFRGGEREVKVYDIEIFYSKSMTLLKFNNYEMYTQTSETEDKWKTVEADANDDQQKVLAAFSKCYGKWMKLEAYTEAEIQQMIMDKYGITMDSNPEDYDEQTIIDMQVEMMVYMTASQVSEAYIADINNSNKMNAAYLQAIAGFMTTDTDVNFDKSGNRYELKEGIEYKQKYVKMLNVGYGYDTESPNRVSVAFNVNAADVSVEQAFKVSSKYDSTYGEQRTLEVSALSSFKNVGNTIANVKDEDVKSVYDVLGGALEPVIYDMLMGGSDEGGND